MSRNARVAILIINYNYAQFLQQCIESALNQSYENTEVVVVDNSSNDGSAYIIRAVATRNPRLRYYLLDKNYNQMGALLHVVNRIEADYLTILDSDDFLFPDYVSGHIDARLTLQAPVAFTSSAVLEVDDAGRVLTGGYNPFVMHLDGMSVEQVQFIPREKGAWRWSPGSANMHDLNLIKATKPIGGDHSYVAATDYYFMWLNHAISGSAIILRPLSAYRHHGRNRYGAMPSISGLEIGNRAAVNRSAVRRRDITRELTSRPKEFDRISQGRFWEIMDAPAKAGKDVAAYYADTAVQHLISQNIASLVEAFGREKVRGELSKRMGARAVRRVLGGVTVRSGWRRFCLTR